MDDNNTIINNYLMSLSTMITGLNNNLGALSDNANINKGIINTADIQIIAINSQIIVLQNLLDNYFGV